MRNELEYLAEIENYLLNRHPDKSGFEKRMETDANLKEDTEILRQLMTSIEEAGIKKEITQIRQEYKLLKALKFLAIAAVVLAGLFAAVWFMPIAQIPEQSTNTPLYQLSTSLAPQNEVGSTDWVQADSVLPSLIYRIVSDEDQVIETPSGLIISIPKGSFLDESGKTVTDTFELVVKEALQETDIMKAGLSTWTSDGKVLETGGMFFINATQNGKNLRISPSADVLVSVPKWQNRNDMKLFDGVRAYATEDTLKQGAKEIRWTNPQEPLRSLVPVSMANLNFYPPRFEQTLSKEGYPNKNKIFKDSVYLSMRCAGNTTAEDSTDSPADSTEVIWFFADGHSEKDPTEKYATHTQRREQLFLFNCGRCHSTSAQTMTGPGLGGIRQRWKSEKDLIAFIKNAGSFLATGDEYANKLYTKFNKMQMPSFPNLSDDDILLILDYLDNPVACGIDPVQVLSFWQPELNHTILATKEFERRMTFIHRTCDEGILACYTKNIDKPLYYCDSLAMGKSSGSQKDQFSQFYAEKLGKPANPKQITQKLLALVAKKQRELDAAYNRTTREWFRKQQKADLMANEKHNAQDKKDNLRMAKNFADELNMNLNKVYADIGNKRPVFSPTMQNNFNTFPLQSTGWKNVDAYTYEATLAQTSMEYTDPNTGKKATLTYKKIQVSVQNASQFDLLETYLIPTGTTSFIRMKKEKGVFNESLNSLLRYNLVSVGYKGKEVFVYTQKQIEATDISIRLVSSTKGEVSRFVSENATNYTAENFIGELNFLSFKQSDMERQADKQEHLALREALTPIVYPCLQEISVHGDYAMEALPSE